MVLGRPVFMDHDPVSRRLQDMDDQQLLSLAEALFCADNDYDLEGNELQIRVDEDKELLENSRAVAHVTLIIFDFALGVGGGCVQWLPFSDPGTGKQVRVQESIGVDLHSFLSDSIVPAVLRPITRSELWEASSLNGYLSPMLLIQFYGSMRSHTPPKIERKLRTFSAAAPLSPAMRPKWSGVVSSSSTASPLPSEREGAKDNMVQKFCATSMGELSRRTPKNREAAERTVMGGVLIIGPLPKCNSKVQQAEVETRRIGGRQRTAGGEGGRGANEQRQNLGRHGHAEADHSPDQKFNHSDGHDYES
ncbi:hypothetical protein B0H13DRAFT_1884476 [Mycena leptocephala]|nr:hypothetical protein B0H13DRAFT_1884476 [Mycena leptocephala]